MKYLSLSSVSLVFGALLALSSAALGAEPQPGQIGFQPPATEIMADIQSFHSLLLVIITSIVIFVTALLVYVMVRYRKDRNPNPSKTSHNFLIEVIWTAVPVLILVVIAIPSFRLLYFEDQVPEADITIKAIGNQWYWTYEYPDHGDLTFDAYMLTDADAAAQELPRLLATDNRVVVPAGKIVKVLVTASDVLHAWTVPSFGVKVDAVPGKTNQLWFKVDKPGVYYGQCSEICGVRHGFMPIMVEVKPQDEFDAWVKEAQVEFASLPKTFPSEGVQVADAR